MKLGAYDYLVKPLDAGQLQQVVDQALAISRLMHVPTIVEEGDRPEDQPDRLIGSGAAMQTVCKQIGRVAPQDVNVLILGESGTGKELVARAIYHHSRRNQAPFLAINCAAIPEPLLESELFGHERGAFTGADRRRIGKFEQAHGGTLLLDEIGDMAPGTQAKILRLLQEGTFRAVGRQRDHSADVRIIAATNQDLDALIERGRFRKDLYYRLRGVTIHLPPLRERREDIAELAHYFLFRFNRQLGTAVQSISPEALELLEKYDWPGNVRELQSVIREALIVSAGPTILPDFLPAELHRDGAAEPEADSEGGPMPDVDWRTLPEFVEAAAAQGETDVYRRRSGAVRPPGHLLRHAARRRPAEPGRRDSRPQPRHAPGKAAAHAVVRGESPRPAGAGEPQGVSRMEHLQVLHFFGLLVLLFATAKLLGVLAQRIGQPRRDPLAGRTILPRIGDRPEVTPPA